MFLPTLAISINLDNDFWFLINQGRYIVENGFPNFEPFTIHEGFDFIIQQWLFDVIIYKIYSCFGKIGIMIMVYLVAIAILIVIYKISMLLSENAFYLSAIFTICIYSVFCLIFIVTRPQIITYLLVLVELFCLETYCKTKNKKILLVLPIISFLQINFHSSMWWIIIAFFLPYLAETIKVKLLGINLHPLDKSPFYLTFIAIVFVGMLNPYNIKAMIYIVKSVGDPAINAMIREMNAPSLSEYTGVIFFMLVFVMTLCYILNRQGKTKNRYILLTLGTILLSLIAMKSVPYFLIGSVIPLIYYMKNISYKLNVENDAKTKFLIVLAIVIFTFLSSFIVSDKVTSYDKTEDYPETKNAIEYLKENENVEKLRVYTGFNDGGYAQYLKIKTYIDPRAEIFLKKSNGKKNVFHEYAMLQHGEIYYKDFLDAYNFTHIILFKGDILYTYLENDDEYKIYYKDENSIIYTLKEAGEK